MLVLKHKLACVPLTLAIMLSSSAHANDVLIKNKALGNQRFFQLDEITTVWGGVDQNSQNLYVWIEQNNQLLPIWNGEIESRVIEDICFYRSAENQQLSLFLIGGRGGADQLLIRQDQQWLEKPLLIREMAIAYDSTACVVDNSTLYIAQGDQAIWSHQAEPEAEEGSNLVAVKAPFGAIKGEVKALEVLADGRLLALEEESPRLLEFFPSTEGFSFKQAYDIATVEALQDISIVDDRSVLLTAEDDSTSSVLLQLTSSLPRKEQPNMANIAARTVDQVAAILQTEAVSRRGDTLDDPAIWVHPTVPDQSRIIATDKRKGLNIYDMQGKLLQELAIGRLNNVDIRGQLAAASLRNDNSIQLFTISDNGHFTVAGNIPTNLSEIYGLCMGYNAEFQHTSVYVNNKLGQIQQFHVSAEGGNLVRELEVPSQPEGCVVDDKQQRLFVGEEDFGVWLFDAAAAGSIEGQMIITIAEHPELVDDIEGLAYAEVKGDSLLFVSSQGNDSYAVFSARAPWPLLAHFRIRTNIELGIDGASETDGIEVTTKNLGGGFEKGAFIVQDGRNRMPESGQNVKLVPLEQILKLLHSRRH